VSSALWHFFWTETDWTGGVVVDSNTGRSRAGGGGHKKERKYERVGDDFWLARERYLSRMTRVEPFEVATTEPPPLPPAEISTPAPPVLDLAGLRFSRDLALAQARSAQTRRDLQAAGSRVADLSMQIRAAQRADDEALLYVLALLT
jgi:hypothetical protein